MRRRFDKRLSTVQWHMTRVAIVYTNLNIVRNSHITVHLTRVLQTVLEKRRVRAAELLQQLVHLLQMNIPLENTITQMSTGYLLESGPNEVLAFERARDADKHVDDVLRTHFTL